MLRGFNYTVIALIDDLLSVQELPISVFRKESCVLTSAFYSKCRYSQSSLCWAWSHRFFALRFAACLNGKDMNDNPSSQLCSDDWSLCISNNESLCTGHYNVGNEQVTPFPLRQSRGDELSWLHTPNDSLIWYLCSQDDIVLWIKCRIFVISISSKDLYSSWHQMLHNGTEGRSGIVWHRSDVSDPVANTEIGLSLRVTNVWTEN